MGRKVGLVWGVFVLTGIFLTGCVHMQPVSKVSPMQNASEEEIKKMTSRFVPIGLDVNLSNLSKKDRAALVPLVKAAKIIDKIYMEQLWSKNLEVYQELQKDKSTLGQARCRYYVLNKGPWSSIDGNIAFMPGVPAHKVEGANFYPEDMTKEEFESWASTLSDSEQEVAKGFFSVIHRDPKTKSLYAVPYSKEYEKDLKEAAALLNEAADLTENPTLKNYLRLRAIAFLTDDYFKSDVAWMDLDSPIDVTIGPYETYTDEIFGYKAAFEAYIAIRDEQDTKMLQFFGKWMQEIEDHLPIDSKYRNPALGAMAPITVVNLLMGAGDGDHGVRTIAFNLPNDDKVTVLKGTKRVMLKNLNQAKFENILVPIAKVALAQDAQTSINFKWFFTHVLAHEMSHGIGPQQVQRGDEKVPLRHELKELYAAIEEAKADILGLFMLQYLFDHSKGALVGGEENEKVLYTTFLASGFRTLRFGVHESHAKGMAMQMNYLLDKGGFAIDSEGRYFVDFSKIKDAVRDLTHDLLTIEAQGDYDGAKAILDKYSVIRPEMQRILDQLETVPVDIFPQPLTANRLLDQ
ncbi:MAG: hypothetical protein AB7F43_03015 [Bacteriovoracia bacterium]